jgi:hypothetical protein
MRATARYCFASGLFLLVSSPVFLSHAQNDMPASNPPCGGLAIKYRIGAVDPRFGIAREEFRHLIEKAGGAWEEKQKNFQYDPKGKLPINLVYDTRQKLTQTVIAIRASVAAKMAQADLIKEELTPLREDFHTLGAAYAEQEIGYKQAQDRYNQKVKRSNLQGGATEAVSLSFADERRSLQKQLGLLEAKRQELNHATDELNTLIRKRNALIKLADAEAIAFNDSAPANMQFKEGRYVREGNEERIDVFQFEDTDHLLIILAHELGHALGIKHNTNPASIMSPLIHTDRLALTAEDEDGLKAACSLR